MEALSRNLRPMAMRVSSEQLPSGTRNALRPPSWSCIRLRHAMPSRGSSRCWRPSEQDGCVCRCASVRSDQLRRHALAVRASPTLPRQLMRRTTSVLSDIAPTACAIAAASRSLGRRAASNRAASGANAGVGPFHRSSSTFSKSGMSVRSVARSRNRNARSRSRASVLGERRRARARSRPRCASRRNRFEMAELGQHRRRRFRAPAGQAGIAVGAVADQRQVVGDRHRRHAELRDDARFVADRAPSGDPSARRACRARTAPDPCPACR